MAKILSEQGWPNSMVLPHAVPKHVRLLCRAKRPRIAYAGRLVPEKGVNWLFRAAARAGERLNGVEIDVIGDGPERNRLEALSTSLGLTDRVWFAGHLARAESQRRLEKAWVQVVPSLWAEPFGFVAAEALSRGTAVIASDAGGPGEIVDHEETGLIVPTHDIDALAEALVRLTQNPELARRFGDAGVVVADARYDEEKWIDALLDIYSDLLEHRGQAESG